MKKLICYGLIILPCFLFGQIEKERRQGFSIEQPRRDRLRANMQKQGGMFAHPQLDQRETPFTPVEDSIVLFNKDGQGRYWHRQYTHYGQVYRIDLGVDLEKKPAQYVLSFYPNNHIKRISHYRKGVLATFENNQFGDTVIIVGDETIDDPHLYLTIQLGTVIQAFISFRNEDDRYSRVAVFYPFDNYSRSIHGRHNILKDGDDIYWNNRGLATSIEYYVDRLKTGIWKASYLYGKPKLEGSYVSLEDTVRITFHDPWHHIDGSFEKAFFDNDSDEWGGFSYVDSKSKNSSNPPHGKWTFWWRNGQISREAWYEYGKLVKDIHYDHDGKETYRCEADCKDFE
ncbi:MAG: hypothetical protein AB8F95_02940 [Bacteroidia bacterium]